MIHDACPCCEVSRLPHRHGCTFADDCPDECADFDQLAEMRAERDDAIAKLDRMRDRKPLGWLCRDGDGKRIIYPVPLCRTRKEAVAITEAQGYAIEPIPVYGE